MRKNIGLAAAALALTLTVQAPAAMAKETEKTTAETKTEEGIEEASKSEGETADKADGESTYIDGLDWGMDIDEAQKVCDITAVVLDKPYSLFGIDMDVTLNFDDDGLWLIEGKANRGDDSADLIESLKSTYGEGKTVINDNYKLWFYKDAKKLKETDESTEYRVNRITAREYNNYAVTLSMVDETISMPALTEEAAKKWQNPIEGLEWGMTAEEIAKLYSITDDGNGEFTMLEPYSLFGQDMKVTLTVDDFVGLEKISCSYDVEEEGKVDENFRKKYSDFQPTSQSWSLSYGFVKAVRSEAQVKQLYKETYVDPDTVSDLAVEGVMESALATMSLQEDSASGVFELSVANALFFGVFE